MNLADQDLFFSVFENIFNAVFIADSANRISHFNTAARIFFVDPPFDGSDYSLPWLSEELQRFSVNTVTELLLEKELPTRDGLRNYELKYRKVFEVGGAFGGTIVILRDVTERRRIGQALQESEERYRQFVEHLPDAFFAQSQGKIVYANPAFLKLLKCKELGEILGKSVMISFIRIGISLPRNV